MGEDPQNHMADRQNKQPTVFLPHPQYTLVGLLLGPYKRIPAAPKYSCSLQGYKPWVYPFLPQSTGHKLEYSSPWYSPHDTMVPVFSAMSIPLVPTVLVKILEAAMLCSRLAWMKEMVLTITHSASSSSSFTSYFFPSGLAPRREKMACPTPLKGLHLNPFGTATEAVSILSTRWTSLDSSLHSYNLQYPVSRPWFSLHSHKYRFVSMGPGNQATTLL